MKLSIQLTFVLLLLSAGVSGAIAQNLPTASVTFLGDGGILRVNQPNEPREEVTVKLACINVPEGEQPGAREAAQRLSQLLPLGQIVEFREVTTDRAGRSIAELYLNGRSLNLQLVEEGMAVESSSDYGCPSTHDQYLQAEQQARSARLGLWSQSN